MLFAKLFRSQYDSSIANNYLTRWVFNDLVILSDMEGFLDMTPESIARITGVPLEIIRDSIASLLAPDPMSRCKDHDGRRLIPMLDDDGEPRPWGWQIVNKPYYLKIKDAETMRERNRLRQARHRVTKKRDKSVTVTLGHAASHHVTPNKNENESKSEIENREREPHRRAAPAHTRIFSEEAAKHGISVVVSRVDAVQLATAFRACGSEDTFRTVCERWFQSDDDFIRTKWGYAGQYINKKLQALLNAGAVSETAFQKTTTSGGKYADTPVVKGL